MKKSFTLIELLVVIAIIGTLSALLLPNYMAARERARDSQRKSDLKQIQKALELYRQDQTPPAFPTAAADRFGTSGNCGTAFGTTTLYLNKIPCDPFGPTPYIYTVDNDELTYSLCTCLENNADIDGQAVDCLAGPDCSTGKSYTVTQP